MACSLRPRTSSAAHEEVYLAVVPVVLRPRRDLGALLARTPTALSDVVRAWDRNPLLERLERNRVLHLASSQRQLRRAQDANERIQRRDQLLDRMLHSRVFWARRA